MISLLFKDELADFEITKTTIQAKKKSFVRLDLDATAYRLIEGTWIRCNSPFSLALTQATSCAQAKSHSGGAFRQLCVLPICLSVQSSDAISVTHDLLSQSIQHLPHLRHLNVFRGEALAATGDLLRIHCPLFRSLSFFGWYGV